MKAEKGSIFDLKNIRLRFKIKKKKKFKKEEIIKEVKLVEEKEEKKQKELELNVYRKRLKENTVKEEKTIPKTNILKPIPLKPLIQPIKTKPRIDEKPIKKILKEEVTLKEVIKEQEIPFKEDKFISEVKPIKRNKVTVKDKVNPLLEKRIIKELEDSLKKLEYDLLNIEDDLYILTKETNDSYNKDELKEKLKLIEELLLKLEIIKEDMKILFKDSKNLYKLDNEYLNHLLNNYQELLKDDTLLNETKHQEEYKYIIRKIIELEKERDYLEEEVKDKQEALEINAKEFAKLEDKFSDIKNISANLKNIITETEKILEGLRSKVNQSVNISERVEYQIKNSFELFLKTIFLMDIMRRRRKKSSAALTGITALIGASILNDILNPKKTKVTIKSCDIVDYCSDIYNSLNDVSSLANFLNKNISDIRSLKKSFEKDFSIYQDEIPEYRLLLDSMDKVEKELLSRENDIRYLKDNLNVELNKNNQKVKKYNDLVKE